MESWHPHSGEPVTALTRWQMHFEEERVKMILKEFKLMRCLHDLLDHCEECHGDRRLTFESFYHRYPTFPILLAVQCRARVSEHCGPAILFRSFEETFLYETYLEWFGRAQEESRGRPIGVIVPFDGYRGGMLIHNAGDAMIQRFVQCETRQAKMTYDIAGDHPPHRLTVESFPGVIKYLARGNWTPKSDFPEAGLIQQPQLKRTTTISPCMVESVGTGPALVILAWLLRVLHSSSAYDRLHVHRTSEAHRCVVATHEEIAAGTGLSPRKVKRGLAVLRGQALVSSRRYRNGACYELSPDALELLQ